ncbi:MAG TPA: helix-turn-helix domain-containing protein [bacterium]|nr:helix-turn-helix domain-containing protein [bacterium]
MKHSLKNRESETEYLFCKSEEAKDAREFLTKVGDKWTILLVAMLAKSPNRRARFSELRKKVEGISQRMLTTTLRNLERDGFVEREVFPEVPPRVEYTLTPLGVNLLDPLQHLIDWVGENWWKVKISRRKFGPLK